MRREGGTPECDRRGRSTKGLVEQGLERGRTALMTEPTAPDDVRAEEVHDHDDAERETRDAAGAGLGLEEPVADRVEQQRDLVDDRDRVGGSALLDANEADLAEQDRVVREDEDDYRAEGYDEY
nr:hypothetical protein GCM10020241_58170 [Streptoalloteichus tenebrarius]